MARTDPVLENLRRICLSLPDTVESTGMGKPHFLVNEHIFAGCADEQGRSVVSFKLQMGRARAVVRDRRFRPAPYVGHKGWVSMDMSGKIDWGELESMILESYRLVAPKESVARLGARSPSQNQHPASRSPPPQQHSEARAPKARRASRRRSRSRRPRGTPRPGG